MSACGWRRPLSLRRSAPCVLRWKTLRVSSAPHPVGFESRRWRRKKPVTTKVCVIYGLILANHLETLTEFTHEELIVCKALENATDYDLKNFKEIMENYLKPTSNGRRIVFPKDFADIAAFTTTCDWCVYNRIFVSRTAEWGEMEEGVLDISTYYYEANPASVLLDNINAARQTWNYG